MVQLRKMGNDNDGYFVHANVNGKPMHLLCDSGASVTILKGSLLNTGGKRLEPCLTPIKTPLLMVTGEKISCEGKAVVQIHLGKQTFQHEVYFADITLDGIIGIDLMTKNGCDLMLSRTCLKVKGEEIPCNTSHGISLKSVSQFLTLYFVQAVLCILAVFNTELPKVWSRVENWMVTAVQFVKLSNMSLVDVRTMTDPPDEFPKLDSENVSPKKAAKSRKRGKKRKRRESSKAKDNCSVKAFHRSRKVDKGTAVKDTEPKPYKSRDDTPDSPDNDVGFGNSPKCSSVWNASNVKIEIDFEECDRERLRKLQLDDSVLKIVHEWKECGKKPEWCENDDQSLEAKYYWNMWDLLCLRDGVLYRRWVNCDGKETKFLLVVPRSLQPLILRQLHNSTAGAHLGIFKTLSKVKERYFWYGLRSNVESLCATCEICGSRKQASVKRGAPINQFKTLYGAQYANELRDRLKEVHDFARGEMKLASDAREIRIQ